MATNKKEWVYGTIFITMLFIVRCADLTTSDGENIKNTVFDPNFNEVILYDLITYDSSHQAVHPDIVFFPEAKDGYRFYITYTPYPDSDVKKENPCIYVSNDGINFFEKYSGVNPLVDSLTGGNTYNNDPDLYYDQNSDYFYLIYQEYWEIVIQDITQKIILLKSKDTKEWEKKTIITENIKEGDHFSLSPSLIDYKNCYYMFFVDKSDKYTIKYLKSTDIESWDYNTKFSIQANGAEELRPWHLDVIRDENSGIFYMLVSMFIKDREDQHLYIAKSEDLKQWYFDSEPIIKHSKKFHNSKNIYRSTAIITQKDIIIWFSFKTYAKEWRIGIKKFLLSDFDFSSK